MKNMITTKDLGALNELMTFEHWMAVKLFHCSETISNSELKTTFKELAQVHIAHHEALLNYLEENAPEGGQE